MRIFITPFYSKILVLFSQLLMAEVANAGTLAIASGESVAPRLDAGFYLGTPSCVYQAVGTPSQSNGCSTNAVLTDGFNSFGSATSTVNGSGLHAFANAAAFSTGSDYYLSDIFTARADAHASLQDTFFFTNTAPETLTARLTLSAEGTVGAGGLVTGQLTLSDYLNHSTSCYLASNGGSCSTDITFQTAGSLTVYQAIDVFANASIGRGYGSSSETTVNYNDTAFISSVKFFASNGAAVDVSYATDSGYVYPQIALVPEPATSKLLFLGLPYLWWLGKKRAVSKD